MQGLITKEGVGGCLWHDDNTTLQRQWRSGILTVSPNNPLLLGLFIPFFRSKLLRFLSNSKRIVCLLTAYDKLAMYGLRVHSCIDGASHYMLYAKVASDKTQETLFEPFRGVVEKFGAPLRVRSDFVSEHALIRQLMEEVRADTRNPFLVGSSVHNQVKDSFYLLC